MQDAREAVTDRAYDCLARVDVFVDAVFGVKHFFSLGDWDGDGHPVTGVGAREGGDEVDVVVSQPSFE